MARSIRFTIAGMMGVVVGVSVCLVALRSGSHAWSSGMFLLACGILALATVGAVCTRGSERVWWLGFAVFGWGYLTVAFEIDIGLPLPPTNDLLRVVSPWVGPPPPWKPGFHGLHDDAYRIVGHSLFGLLAGFGGATLARLLFGSSTGTTDTTGARATTRRVVGKARWRRPVFLGLGGLMGYVPLLWFAAPRAPGLWAGATLLLTWACLLLLAVASVCGRGRRRAASLGATLFGIGYMLSIFAQPEYSLGWPRITTDRLLSTLRPWVSSIPWEYPAETDAIARANSRILATLDQTIPIQIPEPSPLREVLEFIVVATTGPGGPALPIYVDPVGLQEAEQSMESKVFLVMEGVPLRTTLRLLLRQIGMMYQVKDGVLEITTFPEEDAMGPTIEDPFLTIGQCLLGLLAAGLGGVLAGLMHDASDEPRGAEVPT